jgi:hypothetical protein
MEVDVIQATIAAGTALSAEVDIGSKSLVGLLIPANWTTALGGISFQVSPDGGATWGELTTQAAAAYAISSVTGGTLAYYVALDPATLKGVQALKIRSGTQAAPVNQTNTVTLQLITRLAV